MNILDSAEAAAILKVHPKTIQKLARTGDVPAFRVGNQWRFRLEDLEELAKQGLQYMNHSCLN